MAKSKTPPLVALVTGAAKRIGRALAKDLALHGWQVAIHYGNSKSEAEAVVSEIRKSGGIAMPLQADLSVEGEVQKLISRVTKDLGPVRLLINNAAIFENDSVVSCSRASWDKHMEANLRAPFVLSQCMKTTLQNTNFGEGLIINILDQRVQNLTPNFLSYTLSKSGLWTLTRTLAMALAPEIRVNAIGPGPTLESDRQTEEQFKKQWNAVPLRHGPNVTEICEAMRYLISAKSVTGQMIAIDGGEHMGWAQPSEGIIYDE